MQHPGGNLAQATLASRTQNPSPDDSKLRISLSIHRTDRIRGITKKARICWIKHGDAARTRRSIDSDGPKRAVEIAVRSL